MKDGIFDELSWKGGGRGGGLVGHPGFILGELDEGRAVLLGESRVLGGLFGGWLVDLL